MGPTLTGDTGADGTHLSLVFAGDPHGMNWLRADYAYGAVRLPEGPITAAMSTTREGDEIHTTVTFRNGGSKPYFSRNGDIGITLPLEDRYDLAAEQVTKRCNVHLFCAGTSSFVVALRMGGASPHLGLVLTDGELSSYSIERDIELESNDRGCFILNPAPFELQPGEEKTVAWTIFPFTDLEDFYTKAGERSRFVRVSWDKYVLFPGEHSELVIAPSFDADAVSVNGLRIGKSDDGLFRLKFQATEAGEHAFDVDADGRTVRTRILVKREFAQLVENRCRFIADKQQYRGAIDGLHGAYLTYDNEDEHVFYDRLNDFNAGRERVGMGVLMALYLIALRDEVLTATHTDTAEKIRASLDDFVRYMRRELIDEATGAAFNDFGRDGSFQRLYNAPWYAVFFLMLYRLDADVRDLRIAVKIITRYYDDGGRSFYPLEIPIAEMAAALERAGLTEELEVMRTLFFEHAVRLMHNGTDYPPSEVNYEQSIVAPAVEILLQTHLITGDPSLRVAAEDHIRAMEQFQGMQPDYHLNEVAIRHWDGYWFGKRAQYGDTFPHYWSALTGNAFALLFRLTGDRTYAERASRSLRGVLPMIFDDGRASCAYVFPHSVNGIRSEGYDPYANDQDWGLMFALRQVVANPDAPLL